jgi:hypothetical protein
MPSTRFALTPEQRSELECLERSRRGHADAARRARVILLLARLPHRRQSCLMRLLRYSINVSFDGCCDRRAVFADEDLFRYVVENLDQADARLFGRMTYKMIEAAVAVAGAYGSEV